MSWSPIGRPIRVGLFEHDPDAFNCFRRLPKKPCAKPGAEIEIISMVMKILDWQWEIIDTEREFDVVNDFGNPTPDGNFSGIMGLLAKDKIDMSGLSMRITPARMAFAHFTFPIRYFQQVYIIKRPPENDFRNFVFAPFTTDMWLLLLATIMGVSTMRFACALYWDSRVGSKFNIYTSSVLVNSRLVHSFHRLIQETFGLMLKQRVQDPTAISTMFLEGFLIVAMMSIAQYYQTSMNSRLTAPPSSRIPFLHQNQLIELLLDKDTYLTYYFNLTLEGSTEKNEYNIKRAMAINPIVVRAREADLIKEIQKGGVFYSTYDIEFLPQAVSVWDKRQGLTVIRDTSGILSYVAFGFSISNRKLCQMFNKALLKILPGIASITLGPGYGTKKQAEDITVQTYQVNKQESDVTPECTFTPLPY
uniref:Lig_chan-Glu_bd domain-containing protein n=1 Tax=Caenorhabditis tropicalis TaxID=1561998 RepID=A0A1I7TQQ6_9PELO